MPLPSEPTVRRFLYLLVALDLVLTAVNFLNPPSFLDFDEEKNFTTWYSSGKLLLTALAALWIAAIAPAARRGWQVLAAIFAAMSMDETATAHERAASWLMESPLGERLRARIGGGDAAKDAFLWPVIFSPLIVAILYYFVTFLWGRLRAEPGLLALALAGSALLAVAVVLEGGEVYGSPPVASWGTGEVASYQLFSVLEETAEVFGATALLAAITLHAARASAAATNSESLTRSVR